MNTYSIFDILSVYWIIVVIDLGVLYIFVSATKKNK